MSQSVTFTQRKMATLQLSILNSVRVLWLQLPFYTTWYLNYDLIVHGSILFRIIQILLTVLTTCLAVWLYRNIHAGNPDNKWVRNFMRGYGFYRVTREMDFLKDIDNFENENLKS